LIFGKDTPLDVALKVTNGKQVGDKSKITVFQVKTDDNRRVMVQFGKGPTFDRENCVDLDMLNFTNQKSGNSESIVCMRLDDETSPLHRDILYIQNMIGDRLYKGRDAYFDGCPDMTKEEFMDCMTRHVQHNNLSGRAELFLKVREYSKLQGASYDAKSKTLTRTPLGNIESACTQFYGMAACSIGVHVSMDKGRPKWGMYCGLPGLPLPQGAGVRLGS